MTPVAPLGTVGLLAQVYPATPAGQERCEGVAINTLLRRHAIYRTDHLALVCGDERLTFGELNERVNRLCNGLNDLGLRKGDKVATLLPNSTEVIEIYQAAAKSGLVVVPLSPLLRGDGLANLLNDSDSRIVVTSEDMLPELDQLDLPGVDQTIVVGGSVPPGRVGYGELVAQAGTGEPRTPHLSNADLYNIMYSSGTTGLPKGIMHTHGIREAYCTGFASSYRIHLESVVLHSGSLVFNGAFLTLMPAFYVGCTYVLEHAFDPDQVIARVEQESVTHMKLVPSQIISLLEQPDFNQDKLPTLEMIGTVGAPLLLEHKEELVRRFPNRLYELYGLTEGFVTILDRDDADRKLSSVGIPPPLYEMRIVDDQGRDLPVGEVGEIVGRGPVTTPGYYKRPDLTAPAIKDGWLYSGDLGYTDEDGFLFLVDRKKDLIISGGINVYPRDIEEVVIQHPDVVDVTVFGVADPRWGETPVAAVKVAGTAPADAATIRDWANDRVQARYQKLRDVVIYTEFPTNVAGKTLRRVIRDRYTSGEPSEGING